MFGDVMITTQIDYRNMQFMIFDNGALHDNPLPLEVQQAVILQVVHDYAEMISRVLKEQLAIDPDVLPQALVH